MLAGRQTTYCLYEVLKTQLDSQGSLADTTIAQHHDLVRCCEPSCHCRICGRERGIDVAVKGTLLLEGKEGDDEER